MGRAIYWQKMVAFPYFILKEYSKKFSVSMLGLDKLC